MTAKYVFLVLVAGLFIFTCSKSPIEVNEYVLTVPAGTQLINRSELGSNGDFRVGYQNGNIRSDRVLLSWQAMSAGNFLAYKVFRNEYLLTTIIDPNQSSYLDTILVQNRSYHYKIVAVTREGRAITDTMTIKTPALLPPVNIDFDFISETSIRLYWSNRMASATEFQVWRAQGTDSLQLLATTADTFYLDESVQNNESYIYQVIAQNNFEKSTPAQKFVLVRYLFIAPTLTNVSQVRGSRSVRLEWIDNANAETEFHIFRSSHASEFVRIALVPKNTTFYVDHDTTNALVIGASYTYRLNAVNASDTTAFSGSRTIVIGATSAFINQGFESPVLPAGWIPGGNSNWYVASDQASEGTRSARAGTITHNQTSFLQTSFSANQEVKISFDYKVSSENGFDFLTFYINGSLKDRWSGEQNWNNYQTSYIAGGTTVLEWRYTKDHVSSNGSDTAWIDDVVVQ